MTTETPWREGDSAAPCLAYLALDRLPTVRWMTKVELYQCLVRGRAFLGSRYAERIGLKEAADAAHLSPYHFSRLFRALFQETPHAYLTGVRLNHAKQLMRRGDKTIAEVCEAVGFSSLSSFSRLFRSHYGMSPAAYRDSFARSDIPMIWRP